MWSKDQIFIWDAKFLVRSLDKMNNSRPIIKIFLFPYTVRTEHIFSSNFFILPIHENARYAKMVFRLRIGKLHSFFKYIKRLSLVGQNWGAKPEKKLPKGLKKKKKN